MAGIKAEGWQTCIASGRFVVECVPGSTSTLKFCGCFLSSNFPVKPGRGIFC